MLAHHGLARDLFDSAELLHRNLRDRQAAPLLRQALDEELRALDALVRGDAAASADAGVLDEEALAPLRSDGIDLPGMVASLDDIAARMAADPTARPDHRVFRRLVEQASRFAYRADRLVRSAILSDRQRRVRHLALRASLGTLAVFAMAAAAVLAWWALPGRARQGLHGEYFSGTGFEELRADRIDSRIDFTWTNEAPVPRLESAAFSVRWAGEVHAPTGGQYWFATESDDGARLWVAGRQLVDAWVPQATSRHGGTIELAPGWHPIRIEYFQEGGGAVCRLLWQPPGGVAEVVDSAFLRPG
ncbi:MAG TPA: PA14 domain-containing protein [Thermoanaerobaculia bacterium]|nr:PA14 domain-containing protein [Thermoanaerobaculia bacterium]